jgi:MFS family permease
MPIHKNRIILFCLVTGLFWFSLYAYVPFLTVHAQSMGASYTMLGLIAGSYGFVQMLLRIPLGIQSDLLNKRKPFMLAGIVIAILCALGMWRFETPAGLLAFRASTGAAAATWVVFTVVFSSYFKPQDAPKAMGVLNASLNVGQMAAMFVSGLIAQKFGIRPVFLLGTAGGLAALAFAFFLTENKEFHKEPLNLKELFLVAREPNLMLVCVLGAFSQLITFATAFSFIPVLAREIGADSFELGLLTTLYSLPAVFGSLMVGPVFVKRFGERATLMAGFLLSAGVCAFTPFIRTMPVLFGAQVVGGFCSGILFTLLMGLCIRNVPNRKRATAMGFFQAIYGIGMFAGPSIVGALGDTVGVSWGYALVGVFGLAAALLSGFYRARNGYIREQGE